VTIFAPDFYYYRAWEYFDDVVYSGASATRLWMRTETGDLSRQNLLLYQDDWPTEVSTDSLGFRTVPFPERAPTVLVVGDSTIFGSGLSDNETLAWRLAQTLNVAVFNGGRSNVGNMLKHPGLGHVRIVIEGISERAINSSLILPAGQNAPFRPLIQHTRDKYTAVPFGRVFLPLIAYRTLVRFGGDVKQFVQEGMHAPADLFLEYRNNPKDFDATIDAIAAHDQYLRARGIAYIFMPVPTKETSFGRQMGLTVDDFTENFVPKLAARLRQRGVNVVDLSGRFRKEDARELFFRTDTHWNKTGVELAVKALVADYRELLSSSR